MIDKKFIKIKKNNSIFDIYENLEKKKKFFQSTRIAIRFKKNGKIEGILSLGDLRRNLIKKSSKSIRSIINKKPIIFNIDEKYNLFNQIKNLKKVYEREIDDIIIVSKKNKIHNILDFNEFFNYIEYSNISVIGAGHIGIPLSLFLLKKIKQITLYDKDAKVINNIKKINLPFYERGLPSVLKRSLKDGKLKLSNNLKKINSNIYVICIGTDLKNKKINNKNLISLLKEISKKIFKNCTILIRGTLQVGFSEDVAIKILEKGSGLKCGKDFFYGFIPERLIEGDAINELNTIPQLVSGYSNNCLERVENICSFFFPKIIKLDSCSEGEIIKLATNSVRDLNFAFANEISRISNIYNLSGFDLIQKANQDYPRNNIAKPSVGVGGFCLPKDSIIFRELINKKRLGYKLSNSREINEIATKENIKRILKIKKKYFQNKKIKILIMGIAFKGTPETIDIRNSVSLEMGNFLKRNKSINVHYFDAMGSILKKVHKLDISLVNSKNLHRFDMILLTNNNNKYRDMIYSNIENKKKSVKIIYDFTNMLDETFCNSLGYLYKKI